MNLSNPSEMVSSDFLIGDVGAPFAIGVAVGYFAKKMLRMALFLAGGAIVLLFASEYYGFVQISDTQLQQATNVATSMAKSFGDFLLSRLSSITSKGVSGTAGFFVGFKMG